MITWKQQNCTPKSKGPDHETIDPIPNWISRMQDIIAEVITWFHVRHINIIVIIWCWVFMGFQFFSFSHIRYFGLDMHKIRFCISGQWRSLMFWRLTNFCYSLQETKLLTIRKISYTINYWVDTDIKYNLQKGNS
jgi:hypothetical protein